MRYSQEFIDSIHENPVGSIVEIANQVNAYLEESMTPEGWTSDEQEMLLESVALITTIIEANSLEFSSAMPEIGDDITSNCNALNEFIFSAKQMYQARATQRSYDVYLSRYRTAMNSGFGYEFSQGDLERVQTLINELRDQINSMTGFEAEHKQRLLRRLEKLQQELHKRVSDLDRFWGMIGDAGVVLGKFGEDAKPLVDRIREISEIVWRTQARTEELPSDSPTPLISSDDT